MWFEVTLVIVIKLEGLEVHFEGISIIIFFAEGLGAREV